MCLLVSIGASGKIIGKIVIFDDFSGGGFSLCFRIESRNSFRFATPALDAAEIRFVSQHQHSMGHQVMMPR